MRRPLWTAAQVAATLVVAWFLWRYVERNWADLRAAGAAIDVRPVPLAGAALIVLVTYAMLIGAWRMVLAGWGERLAYGQAARIWCLSNLARYVPGRVWQIAGMAALAREAGVSAWAAAGSAVVVQLLAIATGALVTVIFAPRFSHPLLITGAGLLAAGCAAVLAWPAGAAWASTALSRISGRAITLRAVAPGPLALSALITAAAWILYGFALYLSIQGLTGRGGANVAAATGVFTGSYVAGLVNVFTAAGLGTRELLLVSWLTGPIGAAAATVVTVGSRLLMTITELLAALLTLPLTSPRTDVQHA